MSHNMTELHDHLFGALEALRDEKKPMDIERAKAVCLVADKIIAAAKVEVDYLEIVGHSKGTGLLPAPEGAPAKRVPAGI
jgi:hypothetical protein